MKQERRVGMNEEKRVAAVSGVDIPAGSSGSRARTSKAAAVVIFVLLAIIAGLAFMLLIEDKDDAHLSTKSSENVGAQQMQQKDSEESMEMGDMRMSEDGSSSVAIPDNFSTFTGESVSFYYPNSWGEPTVKSGSVDEYVIVQKHNPNLVYNEVYDRWDFASDQSSTGFTEEDLKSVGRPGADSVLRRDSNRTIWDFGSGHGDCSGHVATVVHKRRVTQISSPLFCTGNARGGNPYIVLNGSDEVSIDRSDYENMIDLFVDSIRLL